VAFEDRCRRDEELEEGCASGREEGGTATGGLPRVRRPERPSRRELLAGMSDAGAGRARVWKRPTPIGDAEAFRGLGGIVAPVLMGFALATVATLAGGSALPGSEAAIAFLVASATCFLYCMQFTSMA
jgi:hypothetical protein